jgi:hypothetical protein
MNYHKRIGFYTWYMPHENVLWLTDNKNNSIVLRVDEYKRFFKIQYSYHDWRFPKETKDKNMDLVIQLAEMISLIMESKQNDN